MVFLAFLFLHKKKPMKKAAAMAIMGMTTAIAILPPSERPPEPLDPLPEALNAEAVDDALVEVADEIVLVWVMGVDSPGFVEVITRTDGVVGGGAEVVA